MRKHHLDSAQRFKQNCSIKEPRYREVTFTKGDTTHVFSVDAGKIIVAPAIFQDHLNKSFSVMHGRLLKAGYASDAENARL